MNEEKLLEEIAKKLHIPIVDIEEAIELSQSVRNQTNERSQYLKVLEDPNRDLKTIAKTYEDLLLFEKGEYKHGEGNSVAAAQILLFWNKRALKEFTKAGLAKDFEQMMYVYKYAPHDTDLDAVMIDAMVELLKKETTTKA